MSFFEKLCRLVYPSRCPGCDDILVGDDLLCPVCRENKKLFAPIREPRCMICGRQMSLGSTVCENCNEQKHEYLRGFPAFEYSSVKDSLYRFKYGSRAEYAKFYANSMARIIGYNIVSLKPDALLPVPIHKKRLQKRGYNQAELLCKRIGEILDIPVYTNLVSRVSDTKPLKNLDRKERENNLKGSFKSTLNDVKLSTIVIIDDIYTTGSTIDELSRTLKECGVQKIYYASVAVGSNITDE